jgi:hypothetical protein
VDAYCFKCRGERKVSNPEPILLRNGRRALRGTCSTCGTKVYRFRKGIEPEFPPPCLGLPPEAPPGVEPSGPPHPPIHG